MAAVGVAVCLFLVTMEMKTLYLDRVMIEAARFVIHLILRSKTHDN